VEKTLEKLPEPLAERIENRIQALAHEPRPLGVEKLQGEDNTYRIRSSDYRIIYEIHDRVLLVRVLTVGNRREVYRKR
jgi:mRNA interferase RelE/StbE